MNELSEQELVRREKLEKLITLGINPYPAASFTTNSSSKEIINNFKENKSVVIAGRLM